MGAQCATGKRVTARPAAVALLPCCAEVSASSTFRHGSWTVTAKAGCWGQEGDALNMQRAEAGPAAAASIL